MLATAVTRFARESVEQVVEEIVPLLKAHWVEIASYPDIVLEPDLDQYRLAEACRQLRLFTVRMHGELVGYAIYLIAPALHYKSSLQAKQDVLYLKPDQRRGRLGWQLIRFADNALRADGVQVVHQHQKAAHPALGALLQREGYVAHEVLWSKRLDR